MRDFSSSTTADLASSERKPAMLPLLSVCVGVCVCVGVGGEGGEEREEEGWFLAVFNVKVIAELICRKNMRKAHSSFKLQSSEQQGGLHNYN